MEIKRITSLALIFALVFGGLVVQMSYVKADLADSNVTVGNMLPVASSANIDSGAASVTLTENTTKTVTVTATVTDDNGCEDITSVQVKFYRTSVGDAASDDENNHYTITPTQDGGSCTGLGDLDATYTATIDVYYYADPTDAGSIYEADDWTAKVTPSDGVGAGTPDTDTIEMSTLTALDVTPTINYGSLVLGEDTGAVDQTTVVTNTGNEGIDVDLDGYGSVDGDGKSMICSFGDIPIGNEKYSTTTATDYSLKTALTDTAVEVDMDIAQRTTAVTTDDAYWGFGLPASGVYGTCSGKVVFTAHSDPNLD